MEAAVRTPAHLWIVGAVSTLWNAFGAFDYVMTQTRNEAYLANFTEAQRAYFDSFPGWADAAWAFGVWGALLGSLLLLLRSGYAVLSFGLSLAGMVVAFGYQYLLSTPPAENTSGMMIGVQIVIWIVAIFLLVYAVKMKGRGVLR
jgi:hypothetical protein